MPQRSVVYTALIPSLLATQAFECQDSAASYSHVVTQTRRLTPAIRKCRRIHSKPELTPDSESRIREGLQPRPYHDWGVILGWGSNCNQNQSRRHVGRSDQRSNADREGISLFLWKGASPTQCLPWKQFRFKNPRTSPRNIFEVIMFEAPDTCRHGAPSSPRLVFTENIQLGCSAHLDGNMLRCSGPEMSSADPGVRIQGREGSDLTPTLSRMYFVNTQPNTLIFTVLCGKSISASICFQFKL